MKGAERKALEEKVRELRRLRSGRTMSYGPESRSLKPVSICFKPREFHPFVALLLMRPVFLPLALAGRPWRVVLRAIAPPASQPPPGEGGLLKPPSPLPPSLKPPKIRPGSQAAILAVLKAQIHAPPQMP